MSQFAYNLSGSKIVVKKFKVGITVGTVGVPIIGVTANNEGVVLGTITAGIDNLGMNIDTATMTRAQNASFSEIEEYVSIVVNPDAVWQSRLSGTAASGGALTAYYNTVASATGILLTLSATSGGGTVDTSAWDDCPIFCYSGANAGHWRSAQPADATDINFPVATGQAWSKALAVDDRFFGVPLSLGSTQSATFTTALDEVNALVSTSVNTASYYRAIDFLLNDVGGNGLTHSYVNLICSDHQFSGSALA